MKEKLSLGKTWSKVIKTATVFLVLVVCVLGGVCSKTDILSSVAEGSKNRAAAEKAGLFMSSQQVDDFFRTQESNNGVRFVEKAADIFDRLKQKYELKLSERTILDHREAYDQIFENLELASQHRYLIFPADHNYPKSLSVNPYENLLRVKLLIVVLTQLLEIAPAKDNPDLAGKYLKLAAYLSSHITDEKTILSTLVRTGTASTIERKLRQLIEQHGRDPKWLHAIEETVQRLDEPYDLRSVLKTEHWSGVNYADLLVKDPKQFYAVTGGTGAKYFGSVPRELLYGRFLPGFKQASLSRLHEAFAKAVSDMPSDPYDLDKSAKVFADLESFTSPHNELSYTLAGMTTGTLNLSIRMIPTEVANRNVLLQTVALLKTGVRPEEGLPLKGRYALDIDGKPIRIKKALTGWIVYSVGEDKIDDGGQEFANRKSDWVVHLPK